MRIAAYVLLIAALAGCSRRPPDDTIANSIKAKFFSDARVKAAHLAVAVKRGEVTLAGEVPGADVQLQAYKLALETNGVVTIHDDMVVVTSPSRPAGVQAPPSKIDEIRASRRRNALRRVSEPEAAAEQPPVQQMIVPPPQPPPVLQQRIAVHVDNAPPVILTQPQPVAIAPEAPPEGVAGNWPIAPATIPETGPRPHLESTQLNGAGATYPAALYLKLFDEFSKRNPQVHVDYQAIGSGPGIRQLAAGTVDFGATDVPLTNDQISNASLTRPILHIPLVMTAVVPIFHLEGVTQLMLTGPVLAAIFDGQITRWNDPVLLQLNPRALLPTQDIVVIHRSDGSGTTWLFSQYLSAVSPAWRSHRGSDTAINWSVGLGAKGNDGVAGLVRSTSGSIGYVDLTYSMQNHSQQAKLQNRAGQFVSATLESVTAAGAGAASSLPQDLRGTAVNQPGAGVYPIAGFTWLIVHERNGEKNKSRTMVELFKWMVASGQTVAPSLGYPPLPKELVARDLGPLGRIN